jgi:hypothetical protein
LKAVNERRLAPPRFPSPVRAAIAVALGAGLAHGSGAAAPTGDVSALPPPATNRIEFARDIKPIFEQSCLRCHGSERPKSRFSLVTRAAALQGGNQNTHDIVPGDSAHSALIRYVARLDPDIVMPPEGKGEPLTPGQVALLRAWIDQGAVWETNAGGPAWSVTVAPTLGGTIVRGDEKKFRERHWTKDGWNGGAEEFLLTDRSAAGAKLTVEGRALAEDYRLVLGVEKNDLGFARFGWEQFRKYSDDTGGYFRDFNPSTFSLDRDLHLDVGRAWVEFGLTLPDWPRLVLGYEYQYRDGEKSTLQWGAVSAGGEPRNIYPAARSIDERVHIIKLDLDHELAGVRIADRFRGEFYDLRTRQLDPRAFNVGDPGPSRLDQIREDYRYFQGANTLRLEKSFTDWLYASAGYLYSKLNADAAFSLDTLFPLGAPPFYAVDRWHSQAIVLERETHAANLSGLLGPWEGLSLSAGVLGDWTRQTGFGRADLDVVTPFFTSAHLATLDGNSDTTRVEENLGLRYTNIPFTVLFAEARLQQEQRGVSEDTAGGLHDFMQRTDATSDARDLRAGFSVSPWSRFSWSAHYRKYRKDSDYDHRLDVSAHDAYPAFLRSRNRDTDEVETKLAWRPWPWLKTSAGYKHEHTAYETVTDPASEVVVGDISPGGRLDSARYDADTYSLNATFTRWRRLALTGTFAYQHTRLAAFVNDSPSVVPYRGDRFSALGSATFAVDAKTDLHVAYAFSWADYGQDNFADGLPLGLHYRDHALTAGLARRLGQHVSARLRYGFYRYDEPGSRGANDYTAHAIFGTLVVEIP